jgi:hypothetical protein
MVKEKNKIFDRKQLDNLSKEIVDALRYIN